MKIDQTLARLTKKKRGKIKKYKSTNKKVTLQLIPQKYGGL